MTLFDQEYLTDIYVKEQREEAREEGFAAGTQSTQKSNALRMHEQGCPADSIVKMPGLSVDTVTEWISDGAVPA